MKLTRSIDLAETAKQISGESVMPGVAPERSQIRALSKALTVVENDYALAAELFENSTATKKNGHVVGITGLPGAGKSSLTNELVTILRKAGKRVAVLAVDPSSANTGGAFLGDRVRMQDHFSDAGVFIRSMASRGAMGGVSQATRAAIRLIQLCGFDYILVETVGVGQSESEIVRIADSVVLVLMPQSGDEIQLMKAGILESADIYVVNKSDLSSPDAMIAEIKDNNRPSSAADWCPPVLPTSVKNQEGIAELMHAIDAHRTFALTHAFAPATAIKFSREILEEALAIMTAKLAPELEKVTPEGIQKHIKEGQSTTGLAKDLLKKLGLHS